MIFQTEREDFAMKKFKENINANAGFIIGTGLAATSFFENMTLRVLLIMFFTGWFTVNLVKIILPNETQSKKKPVHRRKKLIYAKNFNNNRRKTLRKLRYGENRYINTGRRKPYYRTRKFRYTA
jgi:hypothetical protein